MISGSGVGDSPCLGHVGVTRGVVRGHVASAVRVLRDRLAEPWSLTSLTSLADELHLSRSQLVRALPIEAGRNDASREPGVPNGPGGIVKQRGPLRSAGVDREGQRMRPLSKTSPGSRLG